MVKYGYFQGKAMSQISKHDYLIYQLRQEYPLAPRTCDYCEIDIVFPKGDAIPERRTGNFRPDISIRQQERLLAIIEVIDKNPPDQPKLAAQEKLPNAYYFHVDGGFWCSPWCWQNQYIERLCPMPECAQCERLIYTLGFGTHGLVDWNGGDGFGGAVCLECAASRSDGQWRTPGDIALGDPEDRMPTANSTVVELFLSFSDADFWAMVWTNRTTQLSEARRRDETETSTRLDQVEAAFRQWDWDNGERLLQPIGAPLWDRSPNSPALFAWNHDNCVRTALAWRKLREHRIRSLPLSIQACISSRAALDEVVTDVNQIVVIHRGFPDGRFTECGIDREKTNEPIQVTMADTPTCPRCR